MSNSKTKTPFDTLPQTPKSWSMDPEYVEPLGHLCPALGLGERDLPTYLALYVDPQNTSTRTMPKSVTADVFLNLVLKKVLYVL